MPGLALTQAASVLCVHGGQAGAAAALPRVTMSGRPAIGQTATMTVSGCPFTVGTAPSPCVSATWVVAATRVRSVGVALVLLDSTAVAVPNGTGLLVLDPGQARVSAT